MRSKACSDWKWNTYELRSSRPREHRVRLRRQGLVIFPFTGTRGPPLTWQVGQGTVGRRVERRVGSRSVQISLVGENPDITAVVRIRPSTVCRRSITCCRREKNEKVRPCIAAGRPVETHQACQDFQMPRYPARNPRLCYFPEVLPSLRCYKRNSGWGDIGWTT